MRQTLRWTIRKLFAVAIVLLGYWVFVGVDIWALQQRQSSRWESQLRFVPALHRTTVGPGSLIGRVEIPRLGLSAMVVEGDDAETLRHAVGHIPGTALRGHPGSGHRDTFFRSLRNIRENDIITLATLDGNTNIVSFPRGVVRPNDVAVLNANRSQVLTLITCYPFYFVGTRRTDSSCAPRDFQHQPGREA